jgi:hypothetical protein
MRSFSSMSATHSTKSPILFETGEPSATRVADRFRASHPCVIRDQKVSTSVQ